MFKDYGVEFRDEVILLWSILNSRHDFRYLATPTFLCGFPVSFKATCQETGAASPVLGSMTHSEDRSKYNFGGNFYCQATRV